MPPGAAHGASASDRPVTATDRLPRYRGNQRTARTRLHASSSRSAKRVTQRQHPCGRGDPNGLMFVSEPVGRPSLSGGAAIGLSAGVTSAVEPRAAMGTPGRGTDPPSGAAPRHRMVRRTHAVSMGASCARPICGPPSWTRFGCPPDQRAPARGAAAASRTGSSRELLRSPERARSPPSPALDRSHLPAPGSRRGHDDFQRAQSGAVEQHAIPPQLHIQSAEREHISCLSLRTRDPPAAEPS
jgi:hypothetical protein